MEKVRVFSAIEGLEVFDTFDEAKTYIIENFTDYDEGIHPDIEDILILRQTHKVSVVPLDDEELFTINFDGV
jgi:hypothetical protein